jgi:chorismate dehydratase
MRPAVSKSAIPATPRTIRVGSVSYLNAKPLIYGLEGDPCIEMLLDVPAGLLNALQTEQCDIALLPVIDYQRHRGLIIVPSGGIGSDGPTLTVRIFSPVPIEKIQTLACDIDSHTSVALAQVVLAERWGIRPKLARFSGPDDVDSQTAILLIGDKVVCGRPPQMEYQLDLGAAWKEVTGMPFVFAVWTARPEADLADLPQRLENARRSGLANLETIITRDAIPRGWPADLARQYLGKNLQYEIGPRELAAMRKFYELCFKYELIDRPRELDILPTGIAP